MSSMPGQEEDEEPEYISDSEDEHTPAPKGVKETQVLLVREEELEGTLCLGSL
jgi:DNA polymerase delta subunit 3